MEEKQKIKKERKKILKEIITKNKVYKQAEVRQIFKKEYGLDVAQATISRYFDELGIQKDSKKGHYILGQKVVLNTEGNKLLRVLKSAEGKIVDGDWDSLMLKMKPAYVEAVAEQIEQLFKIKDIDIYIFPGFRGTMLIYFDKADEKKVKGYLKKIVGTYQKN